MGVDDIEQGVHYVRLGIDNAYSAQVEIVEEGGKQVIFRKSDQEDSPVQTWLSILLGI